MSNYIGRKNHIAQLTKSIEKNCQEILDDTAESKFNIISIWGKAGVGKTSLLDHVLQSQNQMLEDQLIIRIGKSKEPKTIATIITQDIFADSNAQENKFEEILSCRQKIRRIDRKKIKSALGDIKDEKIRQEIQRKILEEFGVLGVQYLNEKVRRKLRNTPLLKRYAGDFLLSLNDKMPSWSDRLLHLWRKNPGRKIRLQIDLEKELSTSLVTDISNIIEDINNKFRSFLFIIDDYEALGKVLDDFLLKYFLRKLRKETFNSLIVVLGRDPIDWNNDWGDYSMNKDLSIGLELLNEDEARQLLENLGISSEDDIEEIINEAEGLPLLLELMADARLNGQETLWVENYVKRVTEQLTADEMKWLEAICFLDVRVDRDTIGTMLPNEDPASVLDWFKSESSTRISKKENWEVDKIVKKFVRKRVQQDSVQDVTTYLKRAQKAEEKFKKLQKELNERLN